MDCVVPTICADTLFPEHIISNLAYMKYYLTVFCLSYREEFSLHRLNSSIPSGDGVTQPLLCKEVNTFVVSRMDDINPLHVPVRRSTLVVVTNPAQNKSVCDHGDVFTVLMISYKP